MWFPCRQWPLACADLCQLCARSMLTGSPVSGALCETCADVSDVCADECDSLGGDFMQECASICRACADSCREQSSGQDAA